MRAPLFAVELNAIPAPIRRRCGRDPGAYLSDEDLFGPVKRAIRLAFREARGALDAGRDVVVAADRLGAWGRLEVRAPAVDRYIRRCLKALEDEAAGVPE
jgi:hypothetical protein